MISISRVTMMGALFLLALVPIWPASADGPTLDTYQRAEAVRREPLSRRHRCSAYGADISHRGGLPGFVRVDGDVLTIPDFRGNRNFNTLGNLAAEPRASLLFVDFETGDLLQLQGSAQVDWKAAAAEQIAGAERLWRFRVARGWRRKAGSPLRWSFVEYARTSLQTGLWHDRNG